MFGQRYDPGGATLGAEFRVNSYTTDFQQHASVAGNASGEFVVAWSSYGPGYSQDVFAQRYDVSGLPLGGEFRVNSYTTDWQFDPAVTWDGRGNFVVVWNSHNQLGNSYGIFGQRYDAVGSPLGAEFQVNSYTTYEQRSPSIASNGNGNFVVVWSSNWQYSSSAGVFGQSFDRSGAPTGAEFQVNTYTTSDQLYPYPLPRAPAASSSCCGRAAARTAATTASSANATSLISSSGMALTALEPIRLTRPSAYIQSGP